MGDTADRETLMRKILWESEPVLRAKDQREFERFLKRLAGPDQFLLSLCRAPR